LLPAVHLVKMIAALVLAAGLATPPAADDAGRATALLQRYEALSRRVTEPRVLEPRVRDGLVERAAVGAAAAKSLIERPAADGVADLERRAELDETLAGAERAL
jgi:hypothetical protein